MRSGKKVFSCPELTKPVLFDRNCLARGRDSLTFEILSVPPTTYLTLTKFSEQRFAFIEEKKCVNIASKFLFKCMRQCLSFPLLSRRPDYIILRMAGS